MKWICGLALTALLALTMLAFSAWRLTSPDVGIELSTVVIATAFSPQGLDDASDVDALRRQMRREGTTSVDPLGTGVEITRSDLDELSPRELRLKIFREVAKQNYYGQSGPGVTTTSAEQHETTGPPPDGDDVEGLVLHDIHRALRNVVLVLVLFVGMATWGLIRFSHGYGRLVSPSVVLLASAVPYAIALVALMGIVGGGGTNEPPPAGHEPGFGERVGTVAIEAAPLVARTLLPLPSLMVAAAVVVLGTAAVRRRRTVTRLRPPGTTSLDTGA